MATRGQPGDHSHQPEHTGLFAPTCAGTREKPDEFYALVEQLCPAPPGGYLELFARKPRPGWIVVGR